MFIAAILRWGEHRNPVRIRDMSPSGALIQSPVMPAQGTRVSLVRGSYSADGRVAWVDGNRCGLHLESEVDVTEWLSLKSNGEQQRVDQIVALVKAGAVPLPTGTLVNRNLLPQSLSPDDLTADLGRVSKLIENLGDELSGDPETLIRHSTELQNIDIALQMLAAICSEVAASEPGDGSRMARIGDLRNSCDQALRR